METNVGSVDLEELKKAREELDRERGVESDPNMYSNYNPNREELTENSQESNDDSQASDDSSSNYDSALLDELVAGESAELTSAADVSAAPVQNELLDENPLDVGDLINALTNDILSEEAGEQPTASQSEESSPADADDLSIYDSFAEFEVGDASPLTSAVVEEIPAVETVQEVAEPETVETDNESANIPNLADFELNVDLAVEPETVEQPVEEDSINPATTSGLLNLDDFNIGEDEKVEEVAEPQEEKVEEDDFSADIPNLDDFKIADATEEDPMEMDSIAPAVETVADEIEHEDTFEINQQEPSNSIEEIEESSKLLDGTFEGDEDVVPETSSEELTNINLHNEEIANAQPATTVDDGMQIVGSYKQLEDLLSEDEEAQELLKQMEEVTEEAEGQEQTETASVSKFQHIESFKYVDLISTESFKNSDKLSYILGKNEQEEIVYGNLRDSYNIAVFGKETVELNNLVHSILLSLIMKNSVSDINFIMCDSKADSKFEVYNKSSYMYFNRIAKTNKEILDTLIEVSKELEERYNILAETGVKSIEQYNIIAKNDNLKPLPYVLTVFNNYSKAIQLTNSDKINACLHQILKLGRIVGLYLIVVANSPIISDEINYNLPTRISFKQEDANRSLTTLGFAGAEHLSGADDVLLLTLENETVTHLKTPILTKAEIELLIENIEE